jgi:hypothetical protein
MHLFSKIFFSLTLLGTGLGSAPIYATNPNHQEETVRQLPRTGFISRIYQIRVKIGKKQKKTAFYVLDDHYSLYTVSSSSLWKKGDQLTIENLMEDSFDDEDDEDDDDEGDEVGLKVKNHTRNSKKTLLRAGWASPREYDIVDIHSHTTPDYDKVVTVTLDNGTSWKITYFDEKPSAKHWHKGEKVMIFINTSAAQNPFLTGEYLPHFQYNLVNINSHYPFAGEPAELIQ